MGMSAKKLAGVGISPFTALQIVGDFGAALVATGTTSADALQIGNDNAFFGTVAASTGAKLPLAGVGDSVLAYNGGANALTLYAPVGFSLNALTANTGLSVAAGKTVLAVCRDGSNWVTILSA